MCQIFDFSRVWTTGHQSTRPCSVCILGGIVQCVDSVVLFSTSDHCFFARIDNGAPEYPSMSSVHSVVLFSVPDFCWFFARIDNGAPEYPSMSSVHCRWCVQCVDSVALFNVLTRSLYFVWLYKICLITCVGCVYSLSCLSAMYVCLFNVPFIVRNIDCKLIVHVGSVLSNMNS